MFDVFNEELEMHIKQGIANLYWYKSDLKKAWLSSGINSTLCDYLFSKKDEEDKKLSKRKLMDCLYEELRVLDYNRRLEISRNSARILLERKEFKAQDRMHRVEIAETCAIKLREVLTKQKQEKESIEQIRRKAAEAKKEDYSSQLYRLRERFVEISKLKPAERGYELEKIFTELMKISVIPVEEPFKIIGEQIDGAIKYDGHYYIVELKWIKDKANQRDISSLYLKVGGKMEARGLFVAMNGFSSETLSSLPKGKNILVLLLDGTHFTNVLWGTYTFKELLEHAIKQACLRGEIYCSHIISPT